MTDNNAGPPARLPYDIDKALAAIRAARRTADPAHLQLGRMLAEEYHGLFTPEEQTVAGRALVLAAASQRVLASRANIPPGLLADIAAYAGEQLVRGGAT